MISFHKSYKTKDALVYLEEVLQNQTFGDGVFTKRCSTWIEERLEQPYVLMTTSGTHSLELALQLIGIKKGDEVLLPSYTFPSTANGILLAGGVPVFVEVCEDTLMINTKKIVEKITTKTKAILPVHYGGKLANMKEISKIAKEYQLDIIEDAAQGFLAQDKEGVYGGTYGRMGCYSFHGTKDIIAGEGGAIVFQRKEDYEKAKIYRRKGTNAEQFFAGEIKKYEWIAKGSSYSPSELSMALLYSQFEHSYEIIEKRKKISKKYTDFCENHKEELRKYGVINFGPIFQKENSGHLFYLIFETSKQCKDMQENFEKRGVETRTHFIPLHESKEGKKYIRTNNNFMVEENIGKRLLRLPLYPDLKKEEVEQILHILLAKDES